MDREVQLNSDKLDHRQFALAARRLADSFSFGGDPSPWTGSGNEYAQSRPYEQGDSIRMMDWRITARTGRYHVREYEAPKRLPVQILLDTSASMTVSSTAFSKYARAVQIATALALASLDHMRPVGLLGCGSREVRVSPTLSRSQVYLWGHRMRSFGFKETTRLSDTIGQLIASAKNTSMVVILSDLHETGCIQSIKRLACQHDVVAIKLKDPAESGRTGGGMYRTREAETGRISMAHGRSHWFESTDSGEDADIVELKTAGVSHVKLITDQPIASKLKMFFEQRTRSKRSMP